MSTVDLPTTDSTTTTAESIGLTVPRDLAVQVVGSDAGKERRFRPTRTMTKEATAEEVAAVERLMQSFTDSEIHRFHEDRSERCTSCQVNATREQAQALKNFLMAYAAHVRKHLARHRGDARYHRSQHRLDQTYEVVRQINQGLGLGDQDGRTIQVLRDDAMTHMHQLSEQLQSLINRAKAVTADNAEEQRDPDEVKTWCDLQDHIDVCLDNRHRYDEERLSSQPTDKDTEQ